MIRNLPAILVALGLASACSPAVSEPAVWVARDADSTIYLLGTVHVLRPQVAWKTPRLSAVLASCSTLSLEIADVDDAEAIQPFVRRYGYDPEHPLSSHLKPEERAKLAAAAKSLGLAPQQLEVMRPWLAGVALSMAPIVRAGYDSKSGVEQSLKADADARHEPVDGLETGEQQIRTLAGLPEADQLAFLRESLDDFEKAPTELDKLAKAWADGRVDLIDRYVNRDMRKESPALYKSLLADRNTAFAAKIKAMLDGSGTRCVAIGAGHLAGPDSVQARLKALGVATSRY